MANKIENFINNNQYCGKHGGAYSSYYALAETVYKKDIKRDVKDIHRNPINIKDANWDKIVI